MLREEGAELAGREEGGGCGRQDADAAERGGGAVPRAAAVGEVEPGEAGRVRGGAGEGAGAAGALPGPAQRGDQAGGDAAAQVFLRDPADGEQEEGRDGIVQILGSPCRGFKIVAGDGDTTCRKAAAAAGSQQPAITSN